MQRVIKAILKVNIGTHHWVHIYYLLYIDYHIKVKNNRLSLHVSTFKMCLLRGRRFVQLLHKYFTSQLNKGHMNHEPGCQFLSSIIFIFITSWPHSKVHLRGVMNGYICLKPFAYQSVRSRCAAVFYFSLLLCKSTKLTLKFTIPYIFVNIKDY